MEPFYKYYIAACLEDASLSLDVRFAQASAGRDRQRRDDCPDDCVAEFHVRTLRPDR